MTNVYQLLCVKQINNKKWIFIIKNSRDDEYNRLNKISVKDKFII